MYLDPSGHFPFLLLLGLIGLAVGVGIGINNGHTGWQFARDIVLGGSIGFVSRVVIGAGISGALTGSFFSSVSAVKLGAITVYQMAMVGGLPAAGYMMLDNLGNSFHSVTHVFWSGGESARNGAMDLAHNIGGKTMEMTRIGTYLERTGAGLETWKIASFNFASQVPYNGKAYVFLNEPIRETSVWLTVELPELIRRFVEIITGR